MRRLPLLPVLAMATGVALIGCSAGSAVPVAPTPEAQPPVPTQSELAPGWDESPEAPPVPDAELAQADVDNLLQSSASDASSSSCRPDQVRLTFRFMDAATGHRFGVLRAEALDTCELTGWPGLGARSVWGRGIPLRLANATSLWDGSPAPVDTVPLSSGECAVAQTEWLADAAGYDEKMSSIAVQLTANGPGVLVPNEDDIDWGPDSTVRPGPWQPDPGCGVV